MLAMGILQEERTDERTCQVEENRDRGSMRMRTVPARTRSRRCSQHMTNSSSSSDKGCIAGAVPLELDANSMAASAAVFAAAVSSSQTRPLRRAVLAAGGQGGGIEWDLRNGEARPGTHGPGSLALASARGASEPAGMTLTPQQSAPMTSLARASSPYVPVPTPAPPYYASPDTGESPTSALIRVTLVERSHLHLRTEQIELLERRTASFPSSQARRGTQRGWIYATRSLPSA